MDSFRLIDIIGTAEYEPRSYSGRGMYGKQCVGVTLPDMSAMADIIEACDDTSEAAELFRRMSEDSMGRSIIVYWEQAVWPETPFPDED